jgi:hypothetical protein
MDQRRRRIVLAAAAALIAAVAVFALGRLSVGTPRPAHSGPVGGYFDGLRVGQAQGRELGRALQVGAALPAKDKHVARDAFRAGYTAGANDVFAGYDGGWTFGAPWIVTLEHGDSKIDYRIRDRTPLERGVAYFLCPDGHSLCHERR